MKKLSVLVCICIGAMAHAQVKPAPKPVVKPVAKVAPSPFKTTIDSASYAFGVNIGINLQQQGFDKLNIALLSKALNDVYARKTPILTQQDANNAIQNLYKTNMDKKYPALAIGDNFLATNQKKPGVITLPSGLQYEVIQKADSGTLSPKEYDTVIVNYAGSLVTGTEFENSFKAGKPAIFKVTEVIPGWTEALLMMHVGDKWRIFVPSELGYHLNPRDPNVIPPGSALIFIISLEGIKPGTPTANMPMMMGGQQ